MLIFYTKLDSQFTHIIIWTLSIRASSVPSVIFKQEKMYKQSRNELP